MAQDDPIEIESCAVERTASKPRKSFCKRCSIPFQEAWRDLRTMRWQYEGLVVFLVVLGCSLLALLFFLVLHSVDNSYTFSIEGPCRNLEFDAISRRKFNWWAPEGLFQITFRTGQLSFESAKAVDLIWNLVSIHSFPLRGL